MSENFSPFKLIIFGLVFLGFFSIPIFTVMQMQKVDNEKKIKYDLRQIESWAQVYEMKHDNLEGFSDDIEIRMLKIDLVSATNNQVEMFFSEKYDQYCVKVKKDKKNYCLDDYGAIEEDVAGCTEGNPICKTNVDN